VITPGVRRLVTLGIPGVIAGGVMQLNLVISTIVASLQASAPSWLYYADRVYQLPLGVVGVAIGIVLLPELSRRLRAGDDAGVQASQNRALEFALFLTIPAAVALIVIPQPIVQVLFERGAFERSDTTATALALAAFAAGLPAFVLQKVFQPGFFAREDTRTPMIFALYSVGLNIAGALAMFPFLGHVGIALATTVAAWLNAGLLGFTLSRRGHFHADPGCAATCRASGFPALSWAPWCSRWRPGGTGRSAPRWRCRCASGFCSAGGGGIGCLFRPHLGHRRLPPPPAQ
jgi:putative peptidoglycan lipid II flippase